MSGYDLARSEDDQFEPGSKGTVLRNLLGITNLREIESLESTHLSSAQEEFYDSFDGEHSFTVLDLCEMHKKWLGEIYPFAGQIRNVNIGKDGFQFAAVQFLEPNLAAFERDFLKPLTPCHEESISKAAGSMAKVHGEFIMLHPFREGNGRLGRWLADAMSAEAGYPFPLYGFTERDENGYRAQYLSAVKKAVICEYAELSAFFEQALHRALQQAV